MKLIFFVFFIFNLSQSSYAGEGGLETPVTQCTPYLGSCDYYLCRESLQSCGLRGYWMGFGEHYCSTFMEQVRPAVSEESQTWLDRVGRCLRDEAESISQDADCHQVQIAAISSHTGCYLQTGFCQVPFWEKIKVLQTIYREVTDPRILRVLFEIAGECGISLFFPDRKPDFRELAPDDASL